MTTNGTAPPAVLSPTQAWPSATIALGNQATRAMNAELARHAELTADHAELMRAYVELLGSGARLTCTPARDRAFDITTIEMRLRQIEEELVGRYPDHD